MLACCEVACSTVRLPVNSEDGVYTDVLRVDMDGREYIAVEHRLDGTLRLKDVKRGTFVELEGIY